MFKMVSLCISNNQPKSECLKSSNKRDICLQIISSKEIPLLY